MATQHTVKYTVSQ